jgi:hypothetical protein
MVISNNLKSYKDLIAYQKAYTLALKIYNATESFPKVEQYGLVQQMRRASVSIPSNIAPLPLQGRPSGERDGVRGNFKYLWLEFRA